MQKKPIPEELKNLWLDKLAAEALRESYVKRPFGFKKALMCSRLAITKEKEFWKSLSELYPELGQPLSMNQNDWTVWNAKETD